MNNNTKNTTKTLNTYLVKYGQRLNFCFDYIDCFRTDLVRAENLDAAYSVALRAHVPEGFEKEDGVLRGKWETIDTHGGAERPAFELDDSWGEGDAGSLLWIENVVEVDPEDALTITRYLDALNSCKKRQEESDQKAGGNRARSGTGGRRPASHQSAEQGAPSPKG